MTLLGSRFKSIRDKATSKDYIRTTDSELRFGMLSSSKNGDPSTVLNTISPIDNTTTVGIPTKLVPNALLPDPNSNNSPYSYHEGHPVYLCSNNVHLSYIIYRFARNKQGGLFFRLKDPSNVLITINSTGSGSGSVSFTPEYSGEVAFFIPLSALGSASSLSGEFSTGHINIVISPNAGGSANGTIYDISYINIRPKFDTTTYKVDDAQAQAINVVGGV